MSEFMRATVGNVDDQLSGEGGRLRLAFVEAVWDVIAAKATGLPREVVADRDTVRRFVNVLRASDAER